MQYKQVDRLPSTVQSGYELRRERIRNMLIEIYDNEIECAEVEFSAGEFPSTARALAVVREEARRANRLIYARTIKKTRGPLPNIFVVSQRGYKTFVTVVHHVCAEDCEKAEQYDRAFEERVAARRAQTRTEVANGK